MWRAPAKGNTPPRDDVECTKALRRQISAGRWGLPLTVAAGHRPRHLKRKLENVPQRLQPILPVDLLCLPAVGAAVIADAKLIDSQIALPGNFGAHLHFNAEIVGGSRSEARHPARHHLVARLDVGQRFVEDDVESNAISRLAK